MSAGVLIRPSSVPTAEQRAEAEGIRRKLLAAGLSERLQPPPDLLSYHTEAEYNRLMRYRDEIISLNRHLRMRSKVPPGSLPGPVPTPPKPAVPLKAVVYDAEGDYTGTIYSPDELENIPPGHTLKWERVMGGKRRHAQPSGVAKLDAEVRGLLRK